MAIQNFNTTPARVNKLKGEIIGHAIPVEVLGITDHDGYIHSIYFFDPNGLRLELTIEVAESAVVHSFAQTAHAQLQEWNAEAAQRKTTREQ